MSFEKIIKPEFFLNFALTILSFLINFGITKYISHTSSVLEFENLAQFKFIIVTATLFTIFKSENIVIAKAKSSNLILHIFEVFFLLILMSFSVIYLFFAFSKDIGYLKSFGFFNFVFILSLYSIFTFLYQLCIGLGKYRLLLLNNILSITILLFLFGFVELEFDRKIFLFSIQPILLLISFMLSLRSHPFSMNFSILTLVKRNFKFLLFNFGAGIMVPIFTYFLRLILFSGQKTGTLASYEVASNLAIVLPSFFYSASINYFLSKSIDVKKMYFVVLLGFCVGTLFTLYFFSSLVELMYSEKYIIGSYDFYLLLIISEFFKIISIPLGILIFQRKKVDYIFYINVLFSFLSLVVVYIFQSDIVLMFGYLILPSIILFIMHYVYFLKLCRYEVIK